MNKCFLVLCLMFPVIPLSGQGATVEVIAELPPGAEYSHFCPICRKPWSFCPCSNAAFEAEHMNGGAGGGLVGGGGVGDAGGGGVGAGTGDQDQIIYSNSKPWRANWRSVPFPLGGLNGVWAVKGFSQFSWGYNQSANQVTVLSFGTTVQAATGNIEFEITNKNHINHGARSICSFDVKYTLKSPLLDFSYSESDYKVWTILGSSVSGSD